MARAWAALLGASDAEITSLRACQEMVGQEWTLPSRRYVMRRRHTVNFYPSRAGFATERLRRATTPVPSHIYTHPPLPDYRA